MTGVQTCALPICRSGGAPLRGLLADDEEMMIVEAKAGIADIEAGRYVTIATQADRDALLKRVRARAAVLLEKVRAKDADRVPAPRVTAHAAE